jgi:hypothetical protein
MSSKRTTDHEQIRRWAQARDGKPSRVRLTGEGGDTGLLRIDFPEDNDDEEDAELEEITWDEFFEKFDDKRLAFVETTAAGQLSRFNRFVNR